MLTNERRQMAEREITRATIAAAINRGFILHSVDNGEGDEPMIVHDIKSIENRIDKVMEEAFACDQAHIFFMNPEEAALSWLFIVLGNEGWTVISDYTVDLDPAVEAVEAIVTKWEEEDCK